METIYRITNALGELEIGIDVPEEGNALIVEVQEDGGISTVWLTLEDVQKLYESLGAWLRSA
jgi:predicted NUDIX family phosphoesterase